MDTLPAELVLHFISFLPLTALIAARGVNKRWRYFAQGGSLYHARKALLDLYLAAIDHPNFLSLIQALRPYVRKFNRKKYIRRLTSRGCVLPDIFELWILEWPSKAVHFWAWPGITLAVNVGHKNYYNHLMGGQLLANSRAVRIIDTIPVPKREAVHVGQPTCKALGLFEVYFYSRAGKAMLWMVVDGNERINDRREGKLLWTYSYNHFTDGDNNPDPHRIFYDTPFGTHRDFRMIDFLNLLDLTTRQVDENVARYDWDGVGGGIRLKDDASGTDT